MAKKWLSYTKYGVLGAGVLGVSIGLPFAVINSKSYNLFAEVIVSDNTSVLADSSFSETTYDGFASFINKRLISEGKDALLPDASTIPQSSGVWRRPGDTTFSRETTFRGLFASGKDMLIGPGFNHETAIRNVATDPKFSNKGFLLLDSAISDPTKDITNVSSFIFRADQSGFLTGIAACIFLNNNYDIFSGNGGLKVGAFVGLAFPSTMDFLAGFQAGVFAWNASIGGDTATKNPVQWISLGAKAEDYASGGFGVGGGVAKAQQLLNLGADVIMPIAGPQTADVVGEILKQGKTAVVAGVDSAQELQTINKPLPLGGEQTIKNGFKPASGEFKDRDMIIQFSAVKLLDTATERVLDAVFNVANPNKTTDGLIGGFGYVNTGTLENGTVGTSDAGLQQLLLDSKFKLWVDESTMKIKWDAMKSDVNFLAMTASGLFYHGGTNPALLTNSTGAGSFGAFTPLVNGTAQVVDVAPGDALLGKRLNGSKWVVVR